MNHLLNTIPKLKKSFDSVLCILGTESNKRPNLMITIAAISLQPGKFEFEEVELHPPGPDEVMVEMKAAGICHTDWDMVGLPQAMILGHEGAGVITVIGPEVKNLSIGDPVMLNWAIPCGHCFHCLLGNYTICEKHSISAPGKQGQTEKSFLNGDPIDRSFSLGTMATHSVVRKEAVVKIDVDIPFTSAAIVGCGVMTGYGSVVNAAKVKAGSSVAVIGCGGVGLNVIQGARIAGAERIIAIDINSNRLQMAKEFGATHFIQPAEEDRDLSRAAQEVKDLTEGRGADYGFECTGNPALGAAPLRVVRHAGKAIQVSGIEQDLTIDMELFEWDKVYLNPLYGKCNPAIDFPKILRLYKKGTLLLDELVTQTYKLEELGNAFEDMHQGKNAKGVIVFD